MAIATSFQLQQLYIGFFGRPADPAGLSYWLNTAKVSQEQFSAEMSIQPEYTNSIKGLAINQQIDAMYVKLFGRNAEPAGLLYWTNLFTANPSLITTLPLILINAAAAGSVVGSPTYNATSVLDNQALINKSNTAAAYTVDVALTSASQLAYNPTSVSPWVTGPQFASAVAFIASATSTNIPSTAAVQQSVAAMTATSIGEAPKNAAFIAARIAYDAAALASTNSLTAANTANAAYDAAAASVTTVAQANAAVVLAATSTTAAAKADTDAKAQVAAATALNAAAIATASTTDNAIGTSAVTASATALTAATAAVAGASTDAAAAAEAPKTATYTTAKIAYDAAALAATNSLTAANTANAAYDAAAASITTTTQANAAVVLAATSTTAAANADTDAKAQVAAAIALNAAAIATASTTDNAIGASAVTASATALTAATAAVTGAATDAAAAAAEVPKTATYTTAKTAYDAAALAATNSLTAANTANAAYDAAAASVTTFAQANAAVVLAATSTTAAAQADTDAKAQVVAATALDAAAMTTGSTTDNAIGISALTASATALTAATTAVADASTDAAAATAAVVVYTSQTFSLTTDQFSYTGNSGNDTFIAGVNNFGLQTLLSADTIDGGGGTNSLTATIIQNVTPAQISNIQNISLTFAGTVASNIDLINATGVQALTNNGSIVAGTISGLNTTTAISHINTALGLTLNYVGVDGANDTAALTISNVTNGTVNIPNIETLNLTSSGAATNTLAALTAAQLTTLNLGGTAGLTITNALDAVTSVNQPIGGAMSGALNLSFTQGAVTATGGAGNDTFTVNGVSGNANLSGGVGNDTFAFAATAFTANDTVAGGDGTTDTLQVIAADVAVANTNITGVEILTVSTAVGATLNTSGINTVNLLAGTAAGGTVVTGPAGTLSLNLGTTTNLGVLAGQLTVNDTDAATTDVLNLSNSNAALNAFNAQALVFGGYETVNLATGSGSTAQTTGVITLTPDGAGTGVLNISGANGITTGAITATTINASGLTGTAALVMSGVTQTATSITGTANADTLIASAAGTLIEAGAGADIVNGGAGNDTLRGGAGNDSITANGGNDNIDGGEGNDRIELAGNLSAADTIDGGVGTNTAVISAAVASAAFGARLSNIQILETSDAAQDMSFFANSTITTIAQGNVGVLAVTNAGATLNTFNTTAAVGNIASSFFRATDTTTDALTINAGADLTAGSDLAVSHEETITLNTATFAVDLDLVNAVDLTTLNITASGSAARALAIDAVGATNLASATFSGINNLSTLNLLAVDSGVSFTATVGDFAATIQSGTGADSLTGGIFNDSLVGNNGADTISGGAGDDTLEGGQGADQISDGTGTDSVTAGTGADIVTLSVDATADQITQGTADSVASTASNVTAALAAGDTLTYANGVDLINGFLAGATNGDVLIVDSVIAQSILGQAFNGLTSTGYLSGNYNTATGVFTVTANGAGADTMIVQVSGAGNNNITTNTSSVILRGVNSANLVNSNFGGSNIANIVPLYGTAGANIFSFQANSFATARIFIAAGGIITPGTQNITPNPATGFSQANMVQADFNNLLGGNGVTFNVAGATSTLLTSVRGSSGDDVIIEATENFGAIDSTVNGGAGIDTLIITTFTANASYGSTAANAVDGQDIFGIENISLIAGTGIFSLTLENSVTVVDNGSVVAITNSSAASDATVILGTGAAHTYTSGSTGIDRVSLGLTGQTATLTGGGVNDVVALGTAGSTVISDGTVLTIIAPGNAHAAQLVANYTNTGVNPSALVLSPLSANASVTTGIMTGFETLDAGIVAANTTITLNAASTGITTLAGDTNLFSIVYNLSLAQLQALTTLTSANTSNSFSVATTATPGGAINLTTNPLVIGTFVDTITFAASTTAVQVTATAAQVAAPTNNLSLGFVGSAFADTLTLTTALTASQLDSVGGFETITLAGAANAITTLDGLVLTNTTVTINGSAITGALTFNGIAETSLGGSFSVTGAAGDDLIVGGAANDTIVSGNGVDTVRGALGNDTIHLADTVASTDNIQLLDGQYINAFQNFGLTMDAGTDIVTGFDWTPAANGDFISIQLGDLNAGAGVLRVIDGSTGAFFGGIVGRGTAGFFTDVANGGAVVLADAAVRLTTPASTAAAALGVGVISLGAGLFGLSEGLLLTWYDTDTSEVVFTLANGGSLSGDLISTEIADTSAADLYRVSGITAAQFQGFTSNQFSQFVSILA